MRKLSKDQIDDLIEIYNETKAPSVMKFLLKNGVLVVYEGCVKEREKREIEWA
ncbi:hypothetical protein QTN46_07655 [Bacillus amyloliquefaciens]|uniref:Uncharacterized protein n=1 Tax=Bacillus amyloliquefaciens TaxID=1390 RepID=A0AAP3YEY3_BACAM|nr:MULTISPECIES: hypothetical protein [Bacillus]MCA1232632.1 hypothetical protein [Bacillus velezensis]MCA1310600.1 hypothetical protein [Bacillus velezensis]MCA1331316.1 hypothetical protein [Bacillus velezensis]MDF4193869.1 hypothetical protein [Bacillus amyloliquefaciens]MDF4213900.1 hypothetical protein [Bacillus amyloliquefaciens]